MSGPGWGGRRVMDDRAYWARVLDAGPVVCGHCGHLVHPDQAWDIDHDQPRIQGGALGRANQSPVHRSCNRRAGQVLSGRTARRLRSWAGTGADEQDG